MMRQLQVSEENHQSTQYETMNIKEKKSLMAKLKKKPLRIYF
jgi:hypothetical protein